jgi:hypothetical protein
MSCTTLELKYESFMTIVQATFFASSCNKVTWLLLENLQYPSLLSKPGSYLGYVKFSGKPPRPFGYIWDWKDCSPFPIMEHGQILVILQDSYFSVGKSSRIFPQQYYSLIPMQASLKPFSSEHFDAHILFHDQYTWYTWVSSLFDTKSGKQHNSSKFHLFGWLLLQKKYFSEHVLKAHVEAQFFPFFSQIECLFVKMTQAESSRMFVANGWQVQKFHTMQVY